MPDLKLNIVVLPTYDVNTLAVNDASTYDVPPTDPILQVDVPSFGIVSDITFNVDGVTILNSTTLGITQEGYEEPLPDGIYCFTYSIIPPDTNYVNKTIIRVDRLQQKFDTAFMKLDMMECDKAIKTQSKVTLNTIYFFIQGAIAAANNCDTIGATKLYQQADYMLDNFLKTNCGCSGNNYIINFS